MVLINNDNTPLRYLLGQFLGRPEELLWEICRFIQNENRDDLEFNLADVNFKTKCCLSENVENDLQQLIDLGYIEKLKYTKYKVLKSLWN